MVLGLQRFTSTQKAKYIPPIPVSSKFQLVKSLTQIQNLIVKYNTDSRDNPSLGKISFYICTCEIRKQVLCSQNIMLVQTQSDTYRCFHSKWERIKRIKVSLALNSKSQQYKLFQLSRPGTNSLQIKSLPLGYGPSFLLCFYGSRIQIQGSPSQLLILFLEVSFVFAGEQFYQPLSCLWNFGSLMAFIYFIFFISLSVLVGSISAKLRFPKSLWVSHIFHRLASFDKRIFHRLFLGGPFLFLASAEMNKWIHVPYLSFCLLQKKGCSATLLTFPKHSIPTVNLFILLFFL